MIQDIPIPPGVPTKAVVLRRGALDVIPSLLPPRTWPVRVCDANTEAAAGQRVSEVLRAAEFSNSGLVLKDVHGEAGEVSRIVRVLKPEHNVILGVGSGVLNDLCKLAARQSGRGYIAVATAASMNGYGSPIAAMIEGGVKRTLPAAPTRAIVADLAVIANAPIEMTRSGFADVLSKASATADWKLAHLVRDEAYSNHPHKLLDPVVRDLQAHAAAFGGDGPPSDEALTLLMKALIYGAFAMVIAGHSAPASGGEHLISHLWDMQAHAGRGRHALHGFQVAIGARVAAALYARLMRLEAKDIDVDGAAARWRPWEEQREALRHVHGDLFESVEPEAKKQHLSKEALRDEVARIRDRWGPIKAAVQPLLLSPQRLRELHEAAGVPLTPEGVGQTRETVRHAMLHAKDVRARFTVFDLAHELGVLEAWADEVLDDAEIR